MMSQGLTSWMLDSDPALRWQVERDLLHEPHNVWEATRTRVATEGYGARLLALQDPDGQWAGGAYFPAKGVHDPEPDDDEGQPWTATTWSLTALREWGLDAAVLQERRTAELLSQNCRWEYDDLPYWGGEVDCCINGYTLANGVWLGADVDGLADWFIEHRLADGGWNCEWEDGSTRSSFHSTLNAIRALLAYDIATGGSEATRIIRRTGEEYLLQRRLTTRLSSGETVGPWVDHFTYPFRWVYSVLNASDYFRAAAVADGVAPDPRMSEAIELIRSARRPDGTWLLAEPHAGRTWFDVDAPAGESSKWLTLHGTRVLDWWDAAGSR